MELAAKHSLVLDKINFVDPQRRVRVFYGTWKIRFRDTMVINTFEEYSVAST